jgi:hypothetical protein
MKWLDKLKPTNALEIADELLEPMEGYPAPTRLEQRAADALRRQHQIILTLEAAQAQVADRLPDTGETMPVAYLAWRDGKPCYEGDDAVCEDAVWPVDFDDDRTSMPVYTSPPDHTAEIERLTKCLKKANSNHEEFERLWYLATDKSDSQKASMQLALEALCLPCARWNKTQTLIINAAIAALKNKLE